MKGKTSGIAENQACYKWHCLGIFLISVFIYLFFNHRVPITDPVEANYALTAKEMVLSADWLSPRIYGVAWFDKPVFFYWLTAISFQLFGFSEWAARLMPAVFAAAGLVLIYWFAVKITSRTAAVLAMLIMGTSFEYIVLAKLIITDMVFFIFNSAALSFFYLGYVKMNGTKRWYLAAYVSMALAVLTKGPVGVLLPGLVMLLFIAVQRNWAELKEMSLPAGLFLFAIVALPWYAAMYVVHGADFINNFFGVHNYLRATVSEHPKDNVSYYYIAVFALSMLPWSAIAIKALLRAGRALWAQVSPLPLFLILWTAVYLGFYSLMATKYLTYTFPILFPVAVLTAIHLETMLTHEKAASILYWAGIPLILLLCGYIAVAYRYLAGSMLALTVACLLLLLVILLWKSRGRAPAYVFKLLCLCQIGSYIVLSVFVFPALAETRSGKGLAEDMAGFTGEQIGLYEFYSTSAVYYNGKIPVKLEPSGISPMRQSEELEWASKYTMPVQPVDDFMMQAPKGLVVVPDKQQEAFLIETAEFNRQLVKKNSGMNYYHVDN